MNKKIVAINNRYKLDKKNLIYTLREKKLNYEIFR